MNREAKISYNNSSTIAWAEGPLPLIESTNKFTMRPLPLRYLRGWISSAKESLSRKYQPSKWKLFLTKSITPLLSKAIKVVDLHKVRDNKAGKIKIGNEITPWVKIPNVASFSIKLNQLDPIFAIFGIKKKYAPTLFMEEYKANGINRYLEHQIIRLSKHRNNPVLYWQLAQILMKRSNCFRVVAIQHVFRKWYRNYPLGFIINTNRKVSKIINTGLSKMDYSRVYIPKGENRWRPLGVPKPEWRLLLHMYSNFLTFFLAHRLINQHGFIPGKGTLTAWQQIFQERLVEKSYIKEWDFKNFFNEIHSNRVSEILLSYHVPKSVVYFLENINRSDIQLPSERKLDESVAEAQKESHENIKNGVLNEESDQFQGVKELIDGTPDQHKVFFETGGGDFIKFDPISDPNKWDLRLYKKNMIKMLEVMMCEDGASDIQEYLQLQWALLDSYRPAKIPTQFNGMAQGSPTSPILANTIMDLWVKQHPSSIHCVAYADDSVSFSNHPIELSPPDDTGIKINPDKSGYVKYEGKWLKPLKFLGLEYDGNIFRAHTRKGSKLALGPRERHLMEVVSQLQEDQMFYNIEEALEWLKTVNQAHEKFGPSGELKLNNSWEDYFKSRLIGFILSRLYQGTWNLDNLEQDFEMNFVRGSWMDTKLRKKKLDIFVASSYANYSLLNIFRHNQMRKKRDQIARSRKDPLTMKI